MAQKPDEGRYMALKWTPALLHRPHHGRARCVLSPYPAEAVTAAARRSGCVAISYTEPSPALEPTAALAEPGRPLGADAVRKDNGFLAPEGVDLAARYAAAVDVDLKTLDGRGHRDLTVARPGPVLDALTGLRERGARVAVSTPPVPGLSHEPRQLRPFARFQAALEAGVRTGRKGGAEARVCEARPGDGGAGRPLPGAPYHRGRPWHPGARRQHTRTRRTVPALRGPRRRTLVIR